ncbi:hypothetical protein STAR110904_01740 [Staphylococcus argensis]
MSDCISKVLQIKDENFPFEDDVDEIKVEGLTHLVFYGKLTYTSERCENCGQPNEKNSIIKNGFKKSDIKILKSQKHQRCYR